MALPAPTECFPRSCSSAFSGTIKKPPNTPSSSSRPNAGSSDCCTAKAITAIPIKIPAGIQRDTVSRVTSFAAAPAPSTIPTATIALR